MNSNYLWRSKWENQWWALVGKEEFRRAAGDCPWGNLSDKWLDVHAHVYILYEGTAANFHFNFYFYLLHQFLVAVPHLYSLHCIAALFLSLCPEAKCPVAFSGGSTFSITSCSVCLCTFSLQISHSIRLKSHVADKSCAEGAPSPCSSVVFKIGFVRGTFSFPLLLFLLFYLCTLPTYLPKPLQL